MILGAIDTAIPSGYTLDAPLTVPALNTPIMLPWSQTASDTPSTTSTTTWKQLISGSVTLPAGTWTVRIIGGVNLAVDVDGDSIDRRAVFGSSEGSTSGGSMTTVREPYPINQTFTGIAGGGTATAALQYKRTPGGTATISSRCPWMMVTAVRTA